MLLWRAFFSIVFLWCTLTCQLPCDAKQAFHKSSGKNTIDLSASEKKLALQANFAAEALLIVKNSLTAKMTLGPTKVYLSESERDNLHSKSEIDLLDQDAANLESIRAKYPELAQVVSHSIRRGNRPRIDNAANEDALKQIFANGGPVPPYLKMFQSQNVAAKPVTTLALQFAGSDHTPNLIRLVNQRLNDLNYNLVQIIPTSVSKRFTDMASAQAYLAEHKDPYAKQLVVEQPGTTFDAIYPIDWQHDFQTPSGKLQLARQTNETLEMAIAMVFNHRKFVGLDNYFRNLLLPDGATVEKLPNRHWKIIVPTRYTVTTSYYKALLVKIGNTSFAQTLADYNVNYITSDLKPANNRLLEALERWDKAYGVTLIEPTLDGPLIRFKTLPQDMDQLMMEIRQLSNDLSSVDEGVNAAHARAAAASLRASQTIRLDMTGKIAVVPGS